MAGGVLAATLKRSGLRKASLQRLFHGIRRKPKGPRRALIGNLPALVDHIQTIGPTCVRFLDPVIQPVHQRRKFDSQLPHTCLRNGIALRIRPRQCEHHSLPNIRFHLPHVRRMRLLNVDHIKRGGGLILLVNLVERGNLPAKRWSSVAPEYQYHRLRSPKRR